MMSVQSVFLRFVLVANLGASAFCATPAYTVVDIGSIGGSCCAQAMGINDAGQVVGFWWTPGGPSRAFVYSGGVMTDLGTLGGTTSSATGINASGQVVGSARLPGDVAFHAFRYSGGTMTDMGTFGGNYSFGQSINASGQVVGQAFLAGDTMARAFLYSNGNLINLGPNTISAYGINNASQVVGVTVFPGDTGGHAFLYSGGSFKNLGTLGGPGSQGLAINNSGQVVGVADRPGNSSRHAFLYSAGSMIDLGDLGSSTAETDGVAINDAGQVVGYQSETNNVQLAFIYSDGVMHDLNSLISLGTSLGIAYGINNSGQIVADGADHHAYLLTPIRQQPLSVTSPTSLTSGSVGAFYGPVQFAADGGAGGNHWAATGLPIGLAIDPTTGVLSGTPTQGGLFAPGFTVTDSSNTTASVNRSLFISSPIVPAPVITSVTPNTVLGTNANQTLFVNGAGFSTGPALRARLSWPGGQVDLPVNFLSSTQLSLSFNFNVAFGIWSAQVINADGQASNTSFFAVVDPGSAATRHFAAPQFTFGGAWYSAFYLSNTTNAAASVQVAFTDDVGSPLAVPLSGLGSVTSQSFNLSAGGTMVLEAPDGSGANSEGWVDVSMPTGVIGYVVFRQVVAGRADQEALVPLSSETSQTADFTYEDILHTTAVAFVNPTSQLITATVIAYGPDGAQVGSTQIVLAPHAKSTNILKSYSGMGGIAGKQGRVVVSVPNGAVSLLALRFGGSAFTDIPINYR